MHGQYINVYSKYQVIIINIKDDYNEYVLIENGDLYYRSENRWNMVINVPGFYIFRDFLRIKH